MQRPRKEQGEKTRQTIIDVTARLFAERGYAGTSLDLVAKEADTSKSSIFWHFQNKEDLLFTVVDQALSVWESRAGDAVLAQPTPPLRFARLLQLHHELANDHSHTLRLLLGLLLETADGDEAIRVRFQRIYEGYRRSAAQIIETGQQEGHFNPAIHPEELACIFLATYDGIFVQRFLDPSSVRPNIYNTVADLLFAVLTPGKARPQLNSL
ncbi:MAG: TetR/AcrR family transcriptional regulator [Myxococcales bacterium]|nr:TetR/AcrR family transcriptional regulator [Myxococcales bacterium]